MDSIDRIQRRYVVEQLRRGVADIFAAQLAIATRRIYAHGHERRTEQRDGAPLQSRSGALLDALTNPRYAVTEHGIEATIPLQLRFLDIKRLGNWQIYNRQVWGILYRETLQNIKYEYRDWLRRNFPEMLASLDK